MQRLTDTHRKDDVIVLHLPFAGRHVRLSCPWRTAVEFYDRRDWTIAIDVEVTEGSSGCSRVTDIYLRHGRRPQQRPTLDELRAGADGWRELAEWRKLEAADLDRIDARDRDRRAASRKGTHLLDCASCSRHSDRKAAGWRLYIVHGQTLSLCPRCAALHDDIAAVRGARTTRLART